MLVLGQSYVSGKTHLITQSLWPIFRDSGHYTILFAKNPQNPLYEDLINDPTTLVLHMMDDTILQVVADIQRLTRNKHPCLFIFDDIVTLRRNIVNELILSLRNSRISTIMSTQYPTLIHPSARGNFSYLFLGHYTRDEPIESIYKTFLRGHGKPAVMASKYKQHIPEHSWLVIDPDDHEYLLQQKE